MKNIKHLLFLSILCSLVLFTNCGDSDDPVAETPTNTSDEDSTTVLDADGDGVADADDTCADTPSGETVDSSGCSDSQKDTDGDGVTDDLDTCADTAEGTTVDENGCADSQKDTDGDGVSDDLDTCADTPEGTTVDENGCAVTFLYLDENSITIKATEYAVVGESYELDSVSYLVVDNGLLYQMITDENDITKVVTSNVTYMRGMFYTLTNSVFNQDISSWDVSNVTDMIGTFHYAASFNQDISSWDVSNVTDMLQMFYGAEAFNQDISSWDVDNVTNCALFSTDATAWTEPKPNFTNCEE
jgi:surface protein